MATTSLSVAALPRAGQPVIGPKADASLPALGLLVEEFSVYQPTYGGAVVYVYKANTTDLAQLFLDETLTRPANNPQVLLSYTDSDGQVYGKFAFPVYSAQAYYLDIDISQQTGIKRPPVTTLAGEDASLAFVKTRGAVLNRNLADRFNDCVRVLDYGQLRTDTPENNATIINLAISAASARGGGLCVLPAGQWPITQVEVPTSVILTGEGRNVTTLQSQKAANVVTITGNDAGLAHLTLDGISLIQGSTGLFSKAKYRIVLKDVGIKRFDTGILHRGGRDHWYEDLYVTNCNKNVRLLGDEDFAAGADGDEFTGLEWHRGEVSLSTSVGLEIATVDLAVRHNSFSQIDFLQNIGPSDGATLIYGAGWTVFRQCYWFDNTIHLRIADSADTTLDDGTVAGVRVDGGQFVEDGSLQFDGQCQDVNFEQVEFVGVTFELNVPVNAILLKDCFESGTTADGDTVKLGRWRTTDQYVVKGSTSTATPVIAWKLKMAPNEVVQLKAHVTAEQVNGTDYAAWEISHAARCAPATLPFDTQTANFTVGNYILGQTSGARGVIVAQTDSGDYGTLSLGDVSGTFVDDELITEESGSGSARVNGYLTYGTAAVVGSKTTQLGVGSNSASPPSNWNVAFATDQQEVQLLLTGDTGDTIIWNARTVTTVL